jgi:hypothetical protein
MQDFRAEQGAGAEAANSRCTPQLRSFGLGISVFIGTTHMEYLPLLSALTGALIGALSSIATLLLQSHYQTKREMKKLAIEVAIKDFIVRVEDKSGKLPQHPIALLINYYDRTIDLVTKNQLTSERMR